MDKDKKKKDWPGEEQRPLTQPLAQNPSCLQITCKFNAAKHSTLCIVFESVQGKYCYFLLGKYI